MMTGLYFTPIFVAFKKKVERKRISQVFSLFTADTCWGRIPQHQCLNWRCGVEAIATVADEAAWKFPDNFGVAKEIFCV